MASLETNLFAEPNRYQRWNLLDLPKYSTKCIGEFSLDSEGNLELGRAQLKYLYEDIVGKQELNIDLTEGMNQQIEKRSTESLDKIFHFLMATNAAGSKLKKAVHGCSFVCRRGTMSRIASSLYTSRSWYDSDQRLVCTKYKGVIFMREYKKPEEVPEDGMEDDYRAKAAYAGRKFEQLALISVAEGREPPDLTLPVDPNPEFNRVFKSALSYGERRLNILCAGEIDAIRKKDQKFVEVKTQTKCMGFGKNFELKAIKWYLQSFLIGVDTLVVGFHEDFVLNRVAEQHFPMEYLLIACWNRGIQLEPCLRFLHEFFESVKLKLDALPEGTILMAERLKGSRKVTFMAIDANDEEGQTEFGVISDEFRQHQWK